MKQFGRWILLFGVFVASTLQAADLYVDSGSPHSVPPYVSWDVAAHSIQAAVSRAADGDTVYVSGGNGTKVYTGSNLAWSQPYVVVLTNRIVSLVGLDSPIIDGQQTAGGVAINKGQIRGFAIRNAVYGGIKCYGGDIFDCLIGNNTSASAGGGIYCNPDSIYTWSVISNCSFMNNISSNSGGGLYVNGARVRVENCRFIQNKVDHELAMPARGGGAYMSGGVMIGCTLSNNTTVGSGTADIAGGGVYLDGAATASNCVIVNNRADKYTTDAVVSGGGACVVGGSELWNCTLAYNVSAVTAGGAYLGGSSAYNCLFKNNQSVNRESVYIQWGSLFNSTVVGYTAGCGIRININGEVDNCIVVSNAASCEVVSAGDTVTFNNNCAYPAYPGPITSGSGTITAHPMFVNYGAGDFRLQAGSPCINTGLNQAWMAGAQDLAGNARIYGAVVDMGAYEAQSAAGSWDSGYADIGGGWRRLTWFGDYTPMGGAGWIWHNKHGFLYPTSASTASDIWFYANDMGWLWTSSTAYPFLYRSSDGAWLWYNGSTNPRWFRNMTAGTWESRP